MRKTILLMFALLMFGVLFRLQPNAHVVLAHQQTSSAQGCTGGEPGGDVADKQMAQSDPTGYAWKLFEYLNCQAADPTARGNAGKPDPSIHSWTSNQPGWPVVWETWASASGGEVFPLAPDPHRRDAWDAWTDRQPASAALQPLERAMRRGMQPATPQVADPGKLAHGFAFDEMHPAEKHPALIKKHAAQANATAPSIDAQTGITLGNNEEVRMNQASYETIQPPDLSKQGFYSQQMIQKAALDAQSHGRTTLVDFPPEAKEVKAAWVQLDCDTTQPNDSNRCRDQKARYHWRIISTPVTGNPGRTQVWGLAALHIMTKDIPNWFWADFIHSDCLSSTAPCKKPGMDGFTRTTCNTPLGCPPPQGSATGPWAYYWLRGTQTDFIDAQGQPVILSNPQLEPGGLSHSSCMSCHAGAAAAIGTWLTEDQQKARKGPILGCAMECQYHGTCPAQGATQAPTQDGTTWSCPVASASEIAGRSLMPSDFDWSMVFRANSEASPAHPLSAHAVHGSRLAHVSSIQSKPVKNANVMPDK